MMSCTVRARHQSSAGQSDPSPHTGQGRSVRRQKILAIRRCLEADPVDLSVLQQLAISRGGLLNNSLRRKAWPKLLNIGLSDSQAKPGADVLSAHGDYNQVVLDVKRSLKRFPPGMEEEHRLALQDELVDVIMWILVQHDELHYYQGYHDICVTFLLVVGEDLTFTLVNHLSTNHLRDFMDVNMDRTKHLLNYLYPIVGKASPELRDFLERSEVGTIFCLSWLITWYGHVLNEFRHIVRLYDFFIACHPLMPVYLAAAIVLHRESEVLSSDCEMCTIHCLLSKIPANLPFEELISKAGDLYLQYPPTDLANEAIISARQISSLNNQRDLKNMSMKRAHSVHRMAGRKVNQVVCNQPGKGSLIIKISIWTLTAALSATAFAILNSATEWAWF